MSVAGFLVSTKHRLQAIEKFLALKDMEELRKYQLGQDEWNSLEICQKILAVRIHLVRLPIIGG